MLKLAQMFVSNALFLSVMCLVFKLVYGHVPGLAPTFWQVLLFVLEGAARLVLIQRIVLPTTDEFFMEVDGWNV